MDAEKRRAELESILGGGFRWRDARLRRAGTGSDLSGLPPAYISACEFDPLRDEALAYGQRLVQAGVPTEMHLYPGTFHGSASAITGAAVSERMQRDFLSALGLALRVDRRIEIEA